VRINSDLRSKPYGLPYIYEFPHTCAQYSVSCGKFCICPHHICGVDCNVNCKGFVCNKCARPELRKTDGPASQLLTHAKMYEIAERYDVVGLKDLAREKFKLGCRTFWDDDAFSTAAHYAFCSTMEDDKGLRDVVSSTISEHIGLIHKAEVQTLLAEHNRLALIILLEKAYGYGW
jgi:hypothetical protein